MNETTLQSLGKSLGAAPDIVDIVRRDQSLIAPVRADRVKKEKELGEFEALKSSEELNRQKYLAGQEAEGIAGKRKTLEESPETARLREVENRLMRDGEFVPTRETAGDMAQLFAIINIAGFAMGAGGKRNAQAAMSGMNGMMEGYQKGRADLYKKEKDQFETNFKNLVQTQKMLREQLTDLAQRADLSLSEKSARARMTALQMNADFVAKHIDKVGLPRAIETLKETEKDLEKAIGIVRKEKERAEEKKQTALYRQQMLASRQPTGRGQIFRDEKTGKMYTVNTNTGDVTEVKVPEGAAFTPMSGKGAVAGQNALTFASRVYGNIENAAADLANIVALPQTSQLPIFSGLLNVERATSLGSLESLAGRAITDKENRAFQQVSDQLGAALSRMEAQGLASGATKASISSFNSLRPGTGDDAINMALYIARVKQEIQTGVRVHDKMPGATAEQKAATKQILEQLDTVVPFDVNDVLQTLRSKKKPLSDKMTKLVTAPPVASGLALGETQAPPAPETRTTPPAQATRKERARPGEQVFTDANGNKAVKRNNEWVEVE